MSAIKKTGKPAPPPKVTRAQITTLNTKKETEKKEKIVTHLDEPLEENINRLKIEGDEARTVDEAIGILRYTKCLCYLIVIFFLKLKTGRHR